MSDNPRVLGNRYEVGDLLGRGGMAEVHIGRDTRLGRVVAIKLLRVDLARDPVFQARFRREAQSAAALNHPTIVAVYDTGEEQVVDASGNLIALPYIVMEYIEGRTLRELLGNNVPIDVPLALDLTAGVLSALEYSHRAGIVHRDIKPANVMLTPAGDVKVMDFGIARALADVSATMTQTQAVIGTAQYLSPEQARGETVDPRSDLGGRLVNVFLKCEASLDGQVHGRRNAMLDDSDVHWHRQIKSCVGGVTASVTGDPACFVSVSAAHQGPDGGGPVAAIVDLGAGDPTGYRWPN